jgi:hypothetical protein
LKAVGIVFEGGFPALHLMYTMEDAADGTAQFSALVIPNAASLAEAAPHLTQISSDLYQQGYYKQLKGRHDARRQQHQQQHQQESNLPPIRPIEQQDAESFAVACGEKTIGLCVIALFNGAPSNADLDKQLETLKAVQVW